MADYVETSNVIALEKLAQLLMSGRKILFITGAGYVADVWVYFEILIHIESQYSDRGVL
jgi:hypothetical protein